MIEERLVPRPQGISLPGGQMPRPTAIRIELTDADEAIRRDAHRLAEDLLALAGIEPRFGAGDGLPMTVLCDPDGLKPEGYRLTVAAEGIELIGADAAGVAYGMQTLLQVLLLADGERIEVLQIADSPAFRVREWMLDLGRATFSVPLLQRCVRIMHRLKLNSLHLHLNDDQLCGLRFDRLPLGSENPHAMTMDDLRRLVAYAASYHVQIIPEWESWGHAASVCFHYPNLRGGPGMWGGMSFAIGEPFYELTAKIYDEIAAALASECDFHVGLDEAVWAVDPSVPAAKKGDYTPETLVGRLHEILQRVGERHRRRLRMRLWADHGGRPLPAELVEKVVIEPWQYHECRADEIRKKVAKFAAAPTPFMCGAGCSSAHQHGTFGASRVWAQAAAAAANCEGIDLCTWESNQIADRLVGVYGGADYAWSPQSPPVRDTDDALGERLRGSVVLNMRRWQAAFPDADDEAIRRDTGHGVNSGLYAAGPFAGRPVAPTAAVEMAEDIEGAQQ